MNCKFTDNIVSIIENTFIFSAYNDNKGCALVRSEVFVEYDIVVFNVAECYEISCSDVTVPHFTLKRHHNSMGQPHRAARDTTRCDAPRVLSLRNAKRQCEYLFALKAMRCSNSTYRLICFRDGVGALNTIKIRNYYVCAKMR